MYRLRIESRLLLGAALLAACSDRSVPTGPPVRPLAATTAVDRPYTWSLKCSGDWPSDANWLWTDASGAPIGTPGSVPTGCVPGQTVSGGDVRPAAATGFSACVNGDTCPHTWTFDPAGPFKAQLKGSSKFYWCEPPMWSRRGHCGWETWTATLNVDS